MGRDKKEKRDFQTAGAVVTMGLELGDSDVGR